LLSILGDSRATDTSGVITVTPVRVAFGVCMPAMALAMMRAGMFAGALSGY